jgi:hypothetical protein
MYVYTCPIRLECVCVCVCVCVHEFVYICIHKTFWTLRASHRLIFVFAQYIFDTIIEYTVAPCFVSAAIPEQALMDETKALDLVREASKKLEALMEQVWEGIVWVGGWVGGRVRVCVRVRVRLHDNVS